MQRGGRAHGEGEMGFRLMLILVWPFGRTSSFLTLSVEKPKRCPHVDLVDSILMMSIPRKAIIAHTNGEERSRSTKIMTVGVKYQPLILVIEQNAFLWCRRG